MFCQFSILNFQFSFSLSFTLFVQKRARNKERTTSARSAFSPAGRVSGDDDDYDVVVVVDDDAIGNVDFRWWVCFCYYYYFFWFLRVSSF